MKRLLLFELLLIFLATTFESDSPPPGWYQQVLPVNDQINDIFFLDSLTGWVVTAGASNGSDTGYVMKTTDGGNSWIVQVSQILNLNVVQFLNANTGYAGGGDGFSKIIKTINGGSNWNFTNSIGGITVTDMYFINEDTGWACNDAPIVGGLWYTTNGSNTWQQQLGESFHPQNLFFLNKDTGWFISSDNKIYKTLNSGFNWFQQANFVSEDLVDVFFINKDTGFVSGAFSPTTIKITTDGGNTWDTTSNSRGGIDIYFVNGMTGYNCANFSIVQKTTNGGFSWFSQTVPSGFFNSIHFPDTIHGWSGGTILIHTTDGGGPPIGIQQIGTEIPSEYKLYQNYPNPFNPQTIIRFQINKLTKVKIVVYDIQGRQITELVNQKQTAGTYEVDFSGSGLSSGVYFYSLIADGIAVDTKKMILIK